MNPAPHEWVILTCKSVAGFHPQHDTDVKCGYMSDIIFSKLAPVIVRMSGLCLISSMEESISSQSSCQSAHVSTVHQFASARVEIER